MQRVLRAAAIGFGERWRRGVDGDEPRLRGQLTVVRGSAGSPVTVTGIRGGALFILRATAEPPWRLEPADRRLAIPIVFKVNRCDRHALLEAQTRFSFSSWAKLPGEEKQHVALRPGPRLKAHLRQLVAAAC